MAHSPGEYHVSKPSLQPHRRRNNRTRGTRNPDCASAFVLADDFRAMPEAGVDTELVANDRRLHLAA